MDQGAAWGGIICDTVLRVYMVQVRYKAGHVKDTEKGGKNWSD